MNTSRRRLVFLAALGVIIAGAIAYAVIAAHRAQQAQTDIPVRHVAMAHIPVVAPPLASAPFALRLRSAGLQGSAGAVDPAIFHVVLRTAPADKNAQNSPFVVETNVWKARAWKDAQGLWLKIPAGRLRVSSQGVLALSDAKGHSLLWNGRITRQKTRLQLTLRHSPQDRFYGAGNAGMNTAGPLTHPAGTSVVANGVTRIPFLWTPSGYGILIANDQSNVKWTDKNGILTWTVPGTFLDCYLMLAPNGYDLLNAYTRLTGRPPLPPRWAFGYLQSRWGYTDAADVQDKWHQFRDRKIPVDAFIYDYDWFVDDWQFNPKTFPSPAQNLAQMHDMGLHFVGIRKPRVHGAHWDEAKKNNWLLVGADLRFDLPAARDWWWSHHAPLLKLGVDGWWNDEAEHSYSQFFHMAQAEWQGQRALNDRRVWSLNRAFAPGMQRWGAAAWTGDIASSWSALQNQPGTLLNWSLAGMPYVGQDIGGFSGKPSPELFARWMECGALVPVMRAHGTFNSPRWPWAFGDEALAASKRAIELRYRLIPYWYTLGEEAARTGAPLMRPLFLEFPNDTKTFNLEDEWLVGRGLLAAPVLTTGGKRRVYLPAGTWYDFHNGTKLQGPQTLSLTVPLDGIPLYVRAGSLLPLGPVMQSTGQAPTDPLELRIYPGTDARFSLYEDDGTTYQYERGAASRIPFLWDNRRHVLTIGKRIGTIPQRLPHRHIHVVLPDGHSQDVLYTGTAQRVSL